MNILRNPAHPAHPSVYTCCSLVVCVLSAVLEQGLGPLPELTRLRGLDTVQMVKKARLLSVECAVETALAIS